MVSTAIIPYIRSRNLLVQGHKLKPQTRFYPYFDGVDISAYCTIASKLIYTPTYFMILNILYSLSLILTMTLII